jgi:hypothetical protein
MSRVPGLSTFEDDQPERGRPLPQRRVEVDWEGGGVRRMPSLRPQAAPVDMYARPAAQPPADKGLLQLADSLGALNGALQKFGTVAHEQNERDAAGRVAQAQRSMTPEAFQGWLNDPTNAGIVQAQAAQGVLGQSAAIRRMQALQEEYATSDRDNMNFDEFVRQRLATDLQGRTPAFASAFNSTITPQLERLRTQHTEFRVGREREAVDSGLTTIYDQTIRDGIAGGATPEQVMEIMNIRRNSDRRFASVDYNRSAQLLMRSLRNLAENEGNRDFIQKFLDMPRTNTNPDGQVQTFPPLSQVMPYGEVDAIRNAARQTDMRNDQVMIARRTVDFIAKADKGELSPEDITEMERLVSRGMTRDSLVSIQNRDRNARIHLETQERVRRLTQSWDENYDMQVRGMTQGVAEAVATNGISGLRPQTVMRLNRTTGQPEAQTFSVADQIKQSTEFFVQGIERDVGNGTLDGREGFNRLATWFQRTVGTHEPWQRVINSAASSANVSSITANNGAPTPEMVQGFELYRQLRTIQPALAERHSNSQARDYFDAAQVFMDMGQTQEQALRSAFASSQLTSDQRNLSQTNVDTALKNLTQDRWVWFVWWSKPQ